MPRICIFGDSIAAGQGVPYDATWAHQCERLLAGNPKAQPLTFSNVSVNGDTTRMALERMPRDVQAFKPDVLVIQFGLNDANFWVSDAGHPRVSPAAFAANLSEMIDRGRRAGAREVLIQTNHLTEENGPVEAKISRLAPCSYREHARHYNEVVRRVAGACDVTLVDVEHLVAGAGTCSMRRLLLADGLHLSAFGHEVYFGAVSPSLLAAIARAV